MSDDPKKAGKADRDRININQTYEVQDWSIALNVTPQQLKKAVQAVGPMVEDVKRHLGK